jgi:hypothetical protein
MSDWNRCNSQIQIIIPVTRSSLYSIANTTRVCSTSAIQNISKRRPKVRCRLELSKWSKFLFKIGGQLITQMKRHRKNWGRQAWTRYLMTTILTASNCMTIKISQVIPTRFFQILNQSLQTNQIWTKLTTLRKAERWTSGLRNLDNRGKNPI